MINGKQKCLKDDWGTPNYLWDQLNNRFNFTIDAAATDLNKKTFARCDDGLVDSWKHERVFCNPPFSQKKDWIKKAHDEVLYNGCPLCVMILPNCLDIDPFNEYIQGKFIWEHLPYRVSFLNGEGAPVSGNPSGTIIVYFWKQIERL